MELLTLESGDPPYLRYRANKGSGRIRCQGLWYLDDCCQKPDVAHFVISAIPCVQAKARVAKRSRQGTPIAPRRDRLKGPSTQMGHPVGILCHECGQDVHAAGKPV